MKWLCLIGLLCCAMDMAAVPARGSKFKARMADGTYQYIRLYGDENRHFYLDAEGCVVEENAGGFFVRTGQKPSPAMPSQVRGARSTGLGEWESAPLTSVGSPKVPVILVNFADVAMTVADTDDDIRDYYNKYFNGTRDGNLYTGAGSRGAVRDYFAQQSDSLFLPEFRVIGPVDLSRPMAYYGANSGGVTDVRFMDFCREALEEGMAAEPDFMDLFDNDRNGEVDLAFFVFAGLPESEAGVTSDALWPRERLSPVTIGGVTVSVMACGSELTSTSQGAVPIGIGTICHELSHALGLPDAYDVENYTALGMSYWSLMDSGNFWADEKIPCGYTAYERDFLRWRPLRVLTEPATVRLKPLESGGEGYKIINDANPDEYYVLENRQSVGWDQKLGEKGHGLLVVHVDYDREAWVRNRVNAEEKHQRMTFIPANGEYVGGYNAQSAEHLYAALGGQPYPGTSGNDSLTDASLPASSVFTGGFMGKPVKQIREMENGDVVFKFMPRGRLEAPEGVVAKAVAQDGFTLAWTEVEHAACYRAEIYGMDGDEAGQLVAVADSVRGTSCEVELPQPSYKAYACRVFAMHDAYEDSPSSAVCRVDMAQTGVRPVTWEGADRLEVFSLDGSRWDVEPEAWKTALPKGIYIMRKGRDIKKVIIE